MPRAITPKQRLTWGKLSDHQKRLLIHFLEHDTEGSAVIYSPHKELDKRLQELIPFSLAMTTYRGGFALTLIPTYCGPAVPSKKLKEEWWATSCPVILPDDTQIWLYDVKLSQLESDWAGEQRRRA